ncbi:U4/U6.U5 tri-snRNP-associated protein 1 [Anoplophora glabripennis]|nr:U4/U6.U5 tri-snRNP-associated protein 1 [Anoplophora glabripennis]
MGSSSKKYKEKESRKRRHRSPSRSYDDDYDVQREKRHKHKKHHHHHKEKRKERLERVPRQEYESDSSDVVEIIPDDSQSAPPTKANDKSPENSSQGVESLSIDETNKLRAKLGLKPLDIGSSSGSNAGAKGDGKKKDDLGEFYHKPAENLQQKAQQEKMRNKLAEAREKRHLHNKYAKVKTLGESDSDDDVESWINKNRKIDEAKKEAEKRAKMLEELDAQFGVSEVVESEKREKMRQKYSERDLKGLTVEHDLDSFMEERTTILTLKDKGVLDEDEDVLVNVNMLDNERYRKSVENKKKKILYNAYEDDEFDEFGNPKEKSLLSKYDEEINGAKKDSFKIGYDNAIERKQAITQSVKEKLAKKKLESIGETQLKLASEYYNEEELAKFKKPKKKVRKIRSKGKLLTADELQEQPQNTGIEAIGSRRPKYKNDPDLNIDDVPSVDIPSDLKIEEKDDLLEKALHKARRIKQKENIVADIIKSEIKTEVEEENIDSGNIILNATAEFCRTLGDIPTYGKAGNREETEELIDFEKDIVNEENSDDDCEIIEPTGWNSVDPTNQGIDSTQITPQEVQILDEEPDVSTGVGAALKLAMSKGYLDKEQNNRPSNSRLAHLQAKHYSIEDKSYGDEGDRQNRRERYSGPITDFKEKDGFKPNVKLEYIDDEGHILNSKEAFRYLSHKFHGKGPGKNKIEKRIKKGVQEQLMKKMSSTDTPLGTLNMLQAKQKETQSPFVVLSGSKQSQSTALSKSRR